MFNFSHFFSVYGVSIYGNYIKANSQKNAQFLSRESQIFYSYFAVLCYAMVKITTVPTC